MTIGRPFRPGQSGNPSGRPKGTQGLAAEIRARTGDGRELIDFAMRVFRDSEEDIATRWQALQWLADRGWGKAMQIIELVTPAPTLDLSQLSDAQLEQLQRLIEVAARERTSIDVPAQPALEVET